MQHSITSSSPELSTTGSDDKLYITALNKALVEREDQLMEVQKRLQSAVEEMEESTHVIKHLSGEKSLYKRKLFELAVMVKNLKAQLREAHERSQGLQEAVKHVDRVVEEKTKDVSKNKFDDMSHMFRKVLEIVTLPKVVNRNNKVFFFQYNELLEQLRNNESIEVANSLEELQSIKATVFSKNKEISDLIRTANKLQGLVNRLDNENSALR